MTLASSHSTENHPRDILVVRFGSLGDLCVLGWTLARLADRPASADRRVTLVTKAAFAPLMENFRGIDEVVSLAGSGTGDVLRLAGQLRRRRWDRVIDAHNILRGHLLLGMMRRKADRRLEKDTLARLAFMGLGRRTDRLDRTMHDRFGELTADLAPTSGKDAITLPPLAGLSDGDGNGPLLGIAPGAQWDTKRWPEEYFENLVTMWLQEERGGIRIFIGPREEAWFADSSLNRLAADRSRVEIIRDRSLTEVAALLAGCQRLVTNDSGLLHVAEAVGTPVLAFFGPTVREFGYYPVLPESRVMERSLDCRPCSRNGKRPCHRKDLACLRDISPAAAFELLDALEENG